MEPGDYLRHTLDPVRLAILGSAAVGPLDIEAIVDAVGVRRQKVLTQIARLTDAGLLTEAGRLDVEALRAIGARLPDFEAPSATIVDGTWTAGEVRTLGSFFEGSRLTSIPSSRSKRLVVLERLAQEFDPGLRYSEREVSSILQVFHDDYAALRRHLVDEGLLTRADGVYWRSGGRYEVEAVHG